jgi:ABC-2 type transport system permease protein
MSASISTAYRWELRKLRSQKRTYLGLGAAALVPVAFAIALALQHSSPNDVAFGKYLHSTGLALPLVLLLFGAVWMFPLIAALVAGDIIAAEDHNGTLKTILTRSTERGQIFAAKLGAATTYSVAAIALTGVMAIAAGSAVSGLHSLTSLSGTHISVGRGLALVTLSLAVYLIPILALTAIGLLLSAVFRNSAAAVVGTLMVSLLLQLLTIIPGLGSVSPYLLSTQFNAWQGLLREPIDWAPITRAIWVCALYGVPAVITALLVFLRRDVDGG